MKHEWRKKEKNYYLPKTKPEIIDIPKFKFITLDGEGNPNSDFFSECIEVLYSMAYGIKMNLKKDDQPKGYNDFTVYPLEGVWDINEEARKAFDGTINKDDFVFKLMIRQPDFVSKEYFNKILDLVKIKKPNFLLDQVNFEYISDGKCIQMMHIGSFDNEPESFKTMEEYAQKKKLKRRSKVHREIYLSDFRRTIPEKLKTVLRFRVK